MRGSIRGAAVLTVALALAALAPASASATSGEITQAEALPGWATAMVAGSATWTGCALEPPEPPEKPKPPGEEGEEEPAVDSPPPSCGWTPFITVGPGTEGSECSSPERQWPESLGSGITLAWTGSKSSVENTTYFAASDVPLDGDTNQLACLGLIESASAFPWHARVSRSLASAHLTLLAKPPACTCPMPGYHPHPHRHHHVKHRRHHIFVSQHQKVPET